MKDLQATLTKYSWSQTIDSLDNLNSSVWFSKEILVAKKCLKRLLKSPRLWLPSLQAPSNQYLASMKAILIKFTQREMESLEEKWRVFTKWNKWAIFVNAGVFRNKKAIEKLLICPENILFEVEGLFIVKHRTLLISLRKWDNEDTNCYFILSHCDVKCWCLSTSKT